MVNNLIIWVFGYYNLGIEIFIAALFGSTASPCDLILSSLLEHLLWYVICSKCLHCSTFLILDPEYVGAVIQ